MFKSTYNADEKIWSGVQKPPVFHPNISVGQALLRSLRLNGEKVAQINADSGVEFTYSQLYTQSIRAAQNLQSLGLKKGDVVAVIAKNNHELTPIVVAITACGYIMNSLDSSFSVNDLIQTLEISLPKLVFVDFNACDTVVEALKVLKNDAKVFTFCGASKDFTPASNLLVETGYEDDFVPVHVDGEKDIALTVSSSGSTGFPKLVCLSHTSLLNSLADFFDKTSEDITLIHSPLYYISGIWFFVAGLLAGAKRIITTDDFTPALSLRLVEEYHVTFILYSAYHLNQLLKSDAIEKNDLSSVRRIISGGSKVYYENIERGMKYFQNADINIGYGLSEVASMATANLPFVRNDTVGRLSSNFRAKIVDDSGKRLGPNESGEICFLTPFTFVEYLKRPEATNEMIDSEGFVCTGDIGYFDGGGNLFLFDRKKDFIRYQKHMISPSQIENFLTKVPEIHTICVTGVADDDFGELPAALIQLRHGKTLSTEKVNEIIAINFPDYKKLRGGIYFVESFPTTSTGKVLRREGKHLALKLYNEQKMRLIK